MRSASKNKSGHAEKPAAKKTEPTKKSDKGTPPIKSNQRTPEPKKKKDNPEPQPRMHEDKRDEWTDRGDENTFRQDSPDSRSEDEIDYTDLFMV